MKPQTQMAPLTDTSSSPILRQMALQIVLMNSF